MTPEKVFTVVFAGLIATSSALQNYTFDEGSLHTVTLPPAVNFTLHNGAIDEATLFSAINATLKKYDSSITLPPFKEIKLSAEIPCVGQVTPCGGNVTKIQNASHQLGHETRKRQYNIPLHDDNDLLYDAPVNIGYPYYQTFTMDFDTGEPSSLPRKIHPDTARLLRHRHSRPKMRYGSRVSPRGEVP